MTFIDSQRLIDEYWHLIGHRSELAQPRDFVRFDIGGEEVVAFHDGAQVVAFDNLCPHRGARIFDGPAGNQRFLCRYHGWSYAKGKVLNGNPTFLADPCPAPALANWQVAWVGDWLFVAKRPRMSVMEQLGGFHDELATISGDLSGRMDLNAYTYECDWRIALENALEPYHVSAIHPESLNVLKLTPGENVFDGLNSVWRSDVGDDRVRRGLARLEPMFDLKFQHKGYISYYLFPFAMISSTFGYSYSVQNFFPSAQPEQTHFVSRLFTSRLRSEDKKAVLQSFFDNSAEVNRRVFEEDHQICRRVPVRSWRADLGYLTTAEEKVAPFRASLVATSQPA